MPRPRALVLSVCLLAIILLPPADGFAARVSGIALPASCDARVVPVEPEKRPTPVPQPPEIRVALADSLLHPPLPPGLPFGATWVDIDGDGDLDLTVPLDRDQAPSLLVYRNDHGVFQDMTKDLGLDTLTRARSAVWLDLDGDGDLDLYVTRRSDADGNRLYENVKGRMVEHPVPGLTDGPGTDVSQAWGDYDQDGDPDLFLGGVLVTHPRLFRNDGDFRFTDVSAQAGIDTTEMTVTAVFSDFDGDGDLDLSLGDVFNFRLFVNQGNGLFQDAMLPIVAPGALLVSPSWADVQGDGVPDLLIGGLFPSLMFENKFDAALPPNQWFANRTGSWGSGPPGGSGGTWADLDLDGDLDLLAASAARGARVFENRVPAGGKLVDISAALALPDTFGVTWQPSAGDYDGDGLPDFFAPHDAVPHLYHNVSIPGGRPLRLHLVPAQGGVALGARVRFENGGHVQVREIDWPASA
ncbi:MAG TPA: FG-GAP-like repeat-containing protein, partial [Candidatus Eisenbacteria bacterium]|nr:FG-GAP-like repeat-containing protein [Candidatus Eisenbacteria bacterium]